MTCTINFRLGQRVIFFKRILIISKNNSHININNIGITTLVWGEGKIKSLFFLNFF